MTDEVTGHRGGGKGVVKAAGSIPLRAVTAGVATRSHVLIGPDDGAPHFAMRRFVMEVGGGMPRHTNTVEHEQFVLRGRGRVVVGDEEHDVGPGDVLLIPAGTPHSYEVLDAPFEFICIVPNADDEITLVDEEEARG